MSISKRGYAILKSSLSNNEIHHIRKELTIQPFEKQRYIVEKFGTLPPSFKIYLESEKKIYVPRYYGIDKFGETEYTLRQPKTVEFKFNGHLRSDQIEIMNEFIPKFQTTRGGILNLKTGGGKTALALYVASLLKVKTLVVVHKTFLVNQWIDRIHNFLPNATIGRIQGKLIETDADIVICMLQSLSMKEYDVCLFENFGLCVFDEVHHVAANVFSNAFRKISTKYLLGLSATLERKDGCERVLKYFLGQVFTSNKKVNFGEVRVERIDFADPEFQQTFYNIKGNINAPKMITRLCESNKRDNLIVSLIEKYVLQNRQILVLSERRFQLDKLQLKLNEKKIDNGLAVGGTKPADLVENCKRNVVLATYSYVSEGFDVDSLDTIIFASPKTDIVQSVGRILRKIPEERINVPLIIDIVDSHFASKYKIRAKYYKKVGFKIS